MKHLSDDLNVRVRERSTTGTEERPKSRLGSFLSKRGGSGDNVGGIQSIVGNNASGTSSIEKKANEIKEQIKRPLSSKIFWKNFFFNPKKVFFDVHNQMNVHNKEEEALQ